MDQLAISTRWAELPLSASKLRRLLEVEFPRLCIHEEVRRGDLEEVLEFVPRDRLYALSLFAPLPNSIRYGAPVPFRMASLHPEERRDALQQGIRALELADSAGIPVVVVPAGELEEPARADVLRLLKKGGPDSAWQALREKRAGAARYQLDSYLSTLASLLNRADHYSLQLALTLGGLPSDLPDLQEVRKCHEEFQGAPLFLLADTLGGARYGRTKGPGAGGLIRDLKPLVRGVVVQDGDLEGNHLPLGAGEVDLEQWEQLREAAPFTGQIPAVERTWIVDLAPHVREEDLLQTRRILERFLYGAPQEFSH